MTKSEIINRLLQLNFVSNEYWLITGGAMVLYDLRDTTRDIDLGCSTALADTLESCGYATTLLPDGTRKIYIAEDIEIFEEWIFDRVDIREGIPVISLKGLLEMKKSLGREKDLEDIKLIEKKLSNLTNSNLSSGHRSTGGHRRAQLYAPFRCVAFVQLHKQTSIQIRMLVCSLQDKLFLNNPPAIIPPFCHELTFFTICCINTKKE